MSAPPDSPSPPGERAWAHYTEPSRVEVDGLNAAYRRQGAGEPVVYLHGGGMTRMWLPFCEALAADVDVIAPEHPGYGDTPMPETLDGFDDLVLHYDGFLRALELDRVHLVGHSLGGWIAANLAIFYPDRFKSLTLLTAIGLRLPEEVEVADIFRWSPDLALEALFNGRGERYLEYLQQEGELEDTLHAYSEAITAARLMWNPRYDHRLDHRLRRLRAPTLVIGAEDDRVASNPMAERFGELIPNSRVVTVQGPAGEPTSHLVHIELPAEVASLVRDHVAANA